MIQLLKYILCSLIIGLTLNLGVYAQTPTTEILSLQAVIISRPDSNVGTWEIGAITVEVTNDTEIKSPNGPLEVGACVTLSYVIVGTTQVALTLEALEAHSCQNPESTATPNGTSNTTWRGTVQLQGRTDHSGAAVFLSEQPCTTATFTTAQTTTDSTGAFAVTSEQVFQCLQITKSLYLPLRQDLTSSSLDLLTMKAGDVNGDNVINILDIATLAANYDQNNPKVDLNADGKVDIFDLVIAASNFK